jgi:thymidylate synthase (FAD)
MIDSCQKTKKGEWRGQSKTNKQGSDSNGIDWPENADIDEVYAPHMDRFSAQGFLTVRDEAELCQSRALYEERLKFGVAKEQARKNLPVSNYTEMYAKVDLKNLMGFFRLRCDSHAQLEIRQYANVMAAITKELFPLSFEAWYDYHFMCAGLTRLDRKLLACYMQDLEEFDHDTIREDDMTEYAKTIGMSDREITEFWEKIRVPDEIDFSLDESKVIL